MEAVNTTLIRENSSFRRLLFLVGALFLLTFYFNLASLSLIVIILSSFLLTLIFKEKIWLFLVLAAPSLVLGKILFLPIPVNWVYEMSLAEAFLLIAAVVFLASRFLEGRLNEIRIDGLSASLLLYLLLSLLSYWEIIDSRLFIFGSKVVVFSFLAYLLSSNLLTGKRLRWFLYGLGLTAFFLSLEIFYKFYAIGWSSRFFFDRSHIIVPAGPIATVAAILTLLLPLVLADYFSERTKAKPFILAAFVLGSLALFLTLGKAAILSLILALVYLFSKLKDKRVAFGLTAVSFVLLSYIFFSSFFNGLFERISYVFADANTQFRFLEYRLGWELIRDHLWFGVGTGQQLLYFNRLLNLEDSQYVNNVFLQAFIDLGLAGLLAALLILHEIRAKLKFIFKKVRREDLILYSGFAASFLAAFLNGLAEVTFFALPYAIIFWSIAGAASALRE